MKVHCKPQALWKCKAPQVVQWFLNPLDIQGIPANQIPGLFLQRFWFDGSEQETISHKPLMCLWDLDWLLRITVCSCFPHSPPPLLSGSPHLASFPRPRALSSTQVNFIIAFILVFCPIWPSFTSNWHVLSLHNNQIYSLFSLKSTF